MFGLFVIRFMFMVHAPLFKWVWQCVTIYKNKNDSETDFFNTKIENLVIVTESIKKINLPLAP